MCKLWPRVARRNFENNLGFWAILLPKKIAYTPISHIPDISPYPISQIFLPPISHIPDPDTPPLDTIYFSVPSYVLKVYRYGKTTKQPHKVIVIGYKCVMQLYMYV